jgi:outer membrane translocation and assembly module TamA
MLKAGEQIPFFMLPSVGGGSSLRGYTSWRFRDRNSMELQAEWRVMVNRYIDTALFYDAGTVAAKTGDLNFDDLKHDYGLGVRFHGPTATPLRVDFATGGEGFHVVFSASPIF